MARPLILDYAPRKEFEPFHERRERFACIVTHYRSDYDDKLQVLRPGPVHDWTSHAADAVPVSRHDAGSESAERVHSTNRVPAARSSVAFAMPLVPLAAASAGGRG
jgi:hypothetical protein